MSPSGVTGCDVSGDIVWCPSDGTGSVADPEERMDSPMVVLSTSADVCGDNCTAAVSGVNVWSLGDPACVWCGYPCDVCAAAI